MAPPIVNARNIRNGWGLNGITQDSDGAAALLQANCRWVRSDMKFLGANGNTGVPNGTGGAQGLATAMVSSGMFDPNPKFQAIIDDYYGDQWSWTNQETFLATALGLKTQNGNKLFAAIEGPNEMGSQGNGNGSIDVNKTALILAADNITGSSYVNVRTIFGNWSNAIATHRSGNATLWQGVELIGPTILDCGQGGSSTTRAPSGLPGDWESAAYPNGDGLQITGLCDYGTIHYYCQNGGQESSAPCVAGQTTYTGYQQAFDIYYKGFRSGFSGGGSSLGLVVSECNPSNGGWSPDGVSLAWNNTALLFDTFVLGGHRVTFFTATGYTPYNLWTTYPTVPTPTIKMLANVGTLMSLSNNYKATSNLTDTAAFTPAYTGSSLNITTTAGTANFGTAGNCIVCPKSDGSTMIIIWREPSYDDQSGTNTVGGAAVPASATFNVAFGSSQTFNIWDPAGASGGNNRTINSTPTKLSGPTTATSANITLYASPIFIELTGVAVTGPPVTPSTPTLGPTTATTQTINWTTITGTNTAPSGYNAQFSSNAGSTWTTAATLGVVGTYTFQGLTPNTLYSFRVQATNSLGTTSSAAITATTAGSSGGTTPALVQVNSARNDNQTGTASQTLSFLSAAQSTNTVWVFFQGYAGTGTNSNAITAPAGSTVVSGPNYDPSGGSEVTWAWIVPYTSTNQYIFTNFDNSNNAGWFILEVSGYSTFDTNHGQVTSVSPTAITWPIVGEAFTNALRLSLLSCEQASTIGTVSPVGATVASSHASTVPFHQGVLVKEVSGTTPTSSPCVLTISGGKATTSDTDAYLNVQIYGGSVPAQVTLPATPVTAITSTQAVIAWNAAAGATSYTVLLSTNGGASFTPIPSGTGLPTSATNFTITGLSANTPYQTQVFASNSAGQGIASSPASFSTLSQNALSVIQSTSAADITPTGTVTATFTTPTTVGNTLVLYITLQQNATNNALATPTGYTSLVAANAVTTVDTCEILCYRTITTASNTVSFTGYIDEAGIAAVEIQGVTSVSAAASGNSATWTDNVSVTIPVVVQGTTPNIGILGIGMEIAPNSFGTPPANTTALTSVLSDTTTPAFHQPALFNISSTGVSRNAVFPNTSVYTFGAGNNPVYANATFFGATAVVAPGATVLTPGTPTTTTESFTWTTASGTVTSYTLNYSTASNMANQIPVSVNALTTTLTGLTQATQYYSTVTAFNGTTPGPVSAIKTFTTLTGATQVPVLIGGVPYLIGGKIATAPSSAGGSMTGQIITSGSTASFTGSSNVLIIRKTTGSATSVTLPSNPTLWIPYTIIDGKGDALTNNITITPASGTIDGSANFVINANYESVSFINDGTTWNVT